MDIETVVWMVVVTGLAAFGGLLYWLLDVVSRDRLMRCPETGAVTFVRTAPAPRGEGTAPEVTVTGCELWPERKGCAQGCLARYEETTPGLRVNLNALRPFETQ